MTERQVKYIGRNTIYGNPVKVGTSCPLCGKLHGQISDVLVCYRRYLFWRLNPDTEALGQKVVRRVYRMSGADISAAQFKKDVLALDGKILICPRCGVNHPNCHGRILENAIVWLKKASV